MKMKMLEDDQVCSVVVKRFATLAAKNSQTPLEL